MGLTLLPLCVIGFFLWGKIPYAGIVSGIVFLLIIGPELVRFVQYRQRFARLVTFKFDEVLIIAWSPSLIIMGSFEIHR